MQAVLRLYSTHRGIWSKQIVACKPRGRGGKGGGGRRTWTNDERRKKTRRNKTIVRSTYITREPNLSPRTSRRANVLLGVVHGANESENHETPHSRSRSPVLGSRPWNVGSCSPGGVVNDLAFMLDWSRHDALRGIGRIRLEGENRDTGRKKYVSHTGGAIPVRDP